MAEQRKKKKPYRDKTFLISESKGQYRVFLFLTVGIVAIIYLKTLCQTIVAGDSAELITACYTLGIAHWPGYPLYAILGNLFINMLSGVSPAFSVNLMSALFAVLTVGFLYAIIYHFTRIPFLSASVALLYGFGEAFWSQAVIAEVNTLHTFLVALVLFMFTLWLEKRSDRVLHYMIPALMGLACTNHQLAILLVPSFIYMAFIFNPKPRFQKFTSNGFLFLWLVLLVICISLPAALNPWCLVILLGIGGYICLQVNDFNWRMWLASLGCFIAGLLVYIYIPIRASMSPAQNWGDPSSLPVFLKAVLLPAGTQSAGGDVWSHILYLFNPLPSVTRDIWPWSRGLWMFEFLSPVFFLFGLYGIYFGLKTGWRMAKSFLLFIILNIIAIIAMSKPGTQELFKVDVYYLQAMLVFSVFIAVGIKEWLQVFGSVFRLKKHLVFSILLILIILAAPLALLYSNYARVDRSDDRRAYLFAGDMASSVDNPDRDIMLVNADDLFMFWYLEKVEGRDMPVYPLVPFPGMPRPASGGEDFWLGWYNRNLDFESEPRVVFPRPAEGSEWLTPEDALNVFIYANSELGKRVYFSSLGPWDAIIDLDSILSPIRPYRAAFKVFTEDELQNSESIIRGNLKFWQEILETQGSQWVGYLDSPAHRPGDEFMISRFAVNLYHHAEWASRSGMNDEAVQFCSMALQVYPGFVNALDMMAHLLVTIGDTDKAEFYVMELIRMDPDRYEYQFTAADFYYNTGKYEKALSHCEDTLRLDPRNPRARELKQKIETALNLAGK